MIACHKTNGCIRTTNFWYIKNAILCLYSTSIHQNLSTAILYLSQTRANTKSCCQLTTLSLVDILVWTATTYTKLSLHRQTGLAFSATCQAVRQLYSKKSKTKIQIKSTRKGAFFVCILKKSFNCDIKYVYIIARSKLWQVITN